MQLHAQSPSPPHCRYFNQLSLWVLNISTLEPVSVHPYLPCKDAGPAWEKMPYVDDEFYPRYALYPSQFLWWSVKRCSVQMCVPTSVRPAPAYSGGRRSHMDM